MTALVNEHHQSNKDEKCSKEKASEDSSHILEDLKAAETLLMNSDTQNKKVEFSILEKDPDNKTSSSLFQKLRKSNRTFQNAEPCATTTSSSGSNLKRNFKKLRFVKNVQSFSSASLKVKNSKSMPNFTKNEPKLNSSKEINVKSHNNNNLKKDEPKMIKDSDRIKNIPRKISRISSSLEESHFPTMRRTVSLDTGNQPLKSFNLSPSTRMTSGRSQTHRKQNQLCKTRSTPEESHAVRCPRYYDCTSPVLSPFANPSCKENRMNVLKSPMNYCWSSFDSTLCSPVLSSRTKYPRVRTYEGSGLTIRIPRQLSDKGLPSSPTQAGAMSPFENRTSNAKVVSKSKSLTTSMDKLSTPLLRPHSKNSSSRESSVAGSRGSTPTSTRSTTVVISRPPSRRSVQETRSPRTPERCTPETDDRTGKTDSPTGSEASIHSAQSANSSQSVASGSSNLSVKSLTSAKSCASGHSSGGGAVRSTSEPPTSSPCKTPVKRFPKRSSPTIKPQVPSHIITGNKTLLRRSSASASSLNSSSGETNGGDDTSSNSPRTMSCKSTPTRQTPPCTPRSGTTQRHSVGSTPNKKPLPVFNSYMSLFQVQEKLKKGEVIEGVLRINPKNYEDAYISAPGGGMDIFIGGVHDRNAALHGDIVAAELNPPSEWKVLRDNLDQYLKEHLDLKSIVYKEIDEEEISKINLKLFSQSNIDDVIVHEELCNEDVIIENEDVIIENEDVIIENEDVIIESEEKEVKVIKKKRRGRGKKNRNASDKINTGGNDLMEEGQNETVDQARTKNKDQNVSVTEVLPTKKSESLESDTNDVILNFHKHTLKEIEAKSLLRNKSNYTKHQTVKTSQPNSMPIQNLRDDASASSSTNAAPRNLDKPKNKQNRSNKNVKSNDLNIYQIFRLSNWNKFVQKTANVVFLLQKKHSRMAAGLLQPFSDMNPHMALFSPFDNKIPRLKIPMSQCPPNFLLRHKDFAKLMLLAKVLVWTEPKFAFGELVRNIGTVGDIEAEMEAMLLENNVDYAEFPETISLDLPTLPWSIPQEELALRTDLRQSLIFTIDPSSAKDLDDALSCLELPSGNFRVGVHIADVSYFINPGTDLDNIAAERATSIYLVDKVIPMLPRSLCENLCSLNPGEDRLAVSCIWEMTPTCEIVGEWFGRTVIRSCSKLSYEDAQSMIENPLTELNLDQFPTVADGYSISDIVVVVNNLHKLALQLRSKRIEDGAVRLDQPKMCFSLDSELKTPNGVFVYEQKDSNKLVEEFMLLANISVAHKIHSSYPEVSVLRRHPPPHEIPMEKTIKLLHQHGIFLDASSSGELATSIEKYIGNDEKSQARMHVITNLCSKPMQHARYFCTGLETDIEEFRHYALNVLRYTHFTSPIRRYADILVHRVLATSLDPNRYPLISLSSIDVEKKAEHCNDRKQASKLVQTTSGELYLALFIRNVGEMVEKGIIIGVLDKAIDVLILKLGIVKRCYMDKLPLLSTQFKQEENCNSLIINWKQENGLPGVTQDLSFLNSVTVALRPFENKALKFNAVLLRPV